MENKKIEIVTTKLVIDTYNRVANWINNDYDTDRQKSDALKIVSQDIVQNILDELMKGINVTTNTEVSRGGVVVGESQIVKDVESFDKVDEKDVLSKLFTKEEPKS